MNNVQLNTISCIVAQEYGPREFQFGSFRNHLSFYSYCKEIGFENNCFYEVLRGSLPMKPYFDIDISLEGLEDIQSRIDMSNRLIKLMIKLIIQIYPQIQETDIFIFNSNSDKKRSYHIVVDRWSFPNNTETKKLYDEIIKHLPKDWIPFVDSVVYKSSQQFRTLYSHKFNTSRIKVIDPLSPWKMDAIPKDREQEQLLTFISSLIQNVKSCTFLPLLRNEEEFESEFEGKLISDVCLSNIQDIINTMEDSNCFTMGKIDGCFITLNRIRPSYCSSCEKTHDHENPFVFISSTDTVFFNCRRGGKSRMIGKLDDTIVVKKVEEFVNEYDPGVQHLTIDEKNELETQKDEIVSPSSVVEVIEEINPIILKIRNKNKAIEPVKSIGSNVDHFKFLMNMKY